MEQTEATELLAQARQAWADKRSATGQLDRLGRYARMTVGMREDYNRASRKLADAEATLQRILGDRTC